MDDVRKSWFRPFHAMLTDGSRTISAGRKPLAMYASCMGEPSQYGSNVGIFWKFLNECRLSWPGEQELGDTRALDVLLTLAFKWHVPLLFQVRVVRMPSMLKWRFTIDPGSLIPLMFQHHVTIKEAGGYIKYWSAFYAILSGEQTEVNKTLIDAAMAMEGDVFKKLLTAMQPPVVQPVLVPITQIGSYTPPLASDQWLRAFRQTQLEPAVRPSDEVLLGDVPFFAVFASVLASYTDKQLLALIAWSFVQLFAPAVDFRLLENRYGLGVALYRPYFCERFVETAYRLLVTALSSVSRFSREERTFIKTGFESLVLAAADMLEEATWLDDESRSLAIQKVSTTRLFLWPPEQFLKSSELERLYEDFPTEEASFGEYWVKASRSAATAYRPREDIDLLGYPVNYALPYFLYDAATASVKVAAGAVTAPLYYSKGTRAMFYGGLGFYMALQLVASMDSQGLRWHPKGSFGDIFFSNTSAKAFEARDGCREVQLQNAGNSNDETGTESKRRSSIFPEVPALEVAHRAYHHAVRGDDAPQGIAGNLSGEQVFFMTLCYMTCTLPGAVGPHTVDCNKVVRNSAAFAEAFSCPTGSPMNPEKKCSFFA
ncbi:hypothetical protein V5799_019533 [Amblyomma americanum]|uniref:M13 family peptidase n=1 Tax=Amblyomma americanum TaxID=6943 RepID=A0AAQ4EWP0_AMBAM